MYVMYYITHMYNTFPSLSLIYDRDENVFDLKILNRFNLFDK